eukprot:m.85788 g.85788  ORF g.85788 m.85788 type:complete len:140 (-) comp12786_c4_seq1:639-1058(-)
MLGTHLRASFTKTNSKQQSQHLRSINITQNNNASYEPVHANTLQHPNMGITHQSLKIVLAVKLSFYSAILLIHYSLLSWSVGASTSSKDTLCSPCFPSGGDKFEAVWTASGVVMGFGVVSIVSCLAFPASARDTPEGRA